MNKIIENIKNRRSIRSFIKDKQIENDKLNAIIEAGLWAPSGHNKQSWKLTVLQNRKDILWLNDKAKESMRKFGTKASTLRLGNNEKYDLFFGAPTLIIVSYEKNGYTEKTDIAASIQNMLLASNSVDIGSCWNGYIYHLFNFEDVIDVKNRFNIGGNYNPYYVVALGYSNQKISNAPKRRENLVDFIK